jgi:predicted AAA+ superfamily ATPase
VDIVIINKEPIPVEVKYGKMDLKGLLSFMKKFKVNEGYVVSPDKEGKQKINEKIISIVPAFKFLLR